MKYKKWDVALRTVVQYVPNPDWKVKKYSDSFTKCNCANCGKELTKETAKKSSILFTDSGINSSPLCVCEQCRSEEVRKELGIRKVVR